MSRVAKLKSTLDVVSTLAVIAASGLLIWTLVQARTGRSLARSSDTEALSGLKLDASIITNIKGHARLAIVEFADYQCPFCGQHAREMAPTIQKELVDSGEAEYVYLHFPLDQVHPMARKAAEAAECAARQARYWEMHDLLFKNDDALTSVDLLRHAATLGLDQRKFQRCLAGESAQKVQTDFEEGRRLGVQATPTFFVGTVDADGGIRLAKRFTGVSSVERFKKELMGLDPKRQG